MADDGNEVAERVADRTAERARLVALREGARTNAQRTSNRLDTIFALEEMYPDQKVHELTSKISDLEKRLALIEEYDEKILNLTDQRDLQHEVEEADVHNAPFRNQIDLQRFQVNALRRIHDIGEDNLAARPTPSTRSASRPKLSLPRFNGDILQWQPFWQAYEAEIDFDDTLANINKFNYLVGQLDQNVLSTVAGLTPSNENYKVLVGLLKERYGRKPKVIAAYMRALYNIQKPEANLKSLRHFYDTVEAYVRGLDSLGKTPDSYGDLLVCILLDKLPSDIRKSVARVHDKDEFSLEELRKAIKAELRVMEAGQFTVPASQPSRQQNTRQTTTMFNGVTESKQPFRFPCAFCGADHPVTQCSIASIEERKKIVKEKRLCFNCLSSKHQKRDCQSRATCRFCKKQHHSSLHDNARAAASSSTVPAVTNAHFQVKSVPQNVAVAVQQSSVNMVSYPFVFLKTAIIKIRSSQCEVKANSMFDEGAQRSWITRAMVKRLGLKAKYRERLITSGFAQASSAPELFEVVELGIPVINETVVVMRAIVIDYLIDPLEDKYRRNLQELQHLKNLNLAHPYNGQNLFAIDLLIGADFYWSFIEDEKPIRGDGPTAISSKIGYLVSGPLESVRVRGPVQTIGLHVQSVDSAEDFSFMWSLETLGIFPHLEKVTEAADYAKRCVEFNDGQYTARFPWKTDHPELPTNYAMVKAMTRSTVKRLDRDGMLKVFADLIKDQQDRRFIEQVPTEQLSKGCHYIPYHYVKKESLTTPIRIVYNCSNKGWNGVSFNDCVETGAPLQNDQIHLLIRFRTHAIGLVADVEKAFHHIKLHESDRDYLRWLWLSNPEDPESPLVVYRFTVVPFGAKSSPFILNSVIKAHLARNESPVTIDMQRSVFVDNIITGCESEAEAESYFHQASDIMSSANLPLQAWGFSNQQMEKKLSEKGVIDKAAESKTLGLVWNRSSDTLSVQVPNIQLPTEKTTKRDVLKGTASFYDPLGFYSPLATSAKILLQDLCINGVKLDDQLADDHQEKWTEIINSILSATKEKSMSMKRSYFGDISGVRDLHIFCDASRRAYGAVAYLVHQKEVAFVQSKVRITPIKDHQREGERELSIPEAELMAAYLGVLIATTIISAMEPLGIKLRVFLWSDSQIVHYWISKDDGHPRQFITNRVKKVRDFNQTHAATWKYVSSPDNPADILSRGASHKELQASKLWKSGPEWLIDRKNWPTWSVTEFKQSKIAHIATKEVTVVSEVTDLTNVIDDHIYSWSTLLKVTGQVFRLLSNLKLKDRSRESWNRQPLSAIELQKAETTWIRIYQSKYFSKELLYLQSKRKAWRPALVSHLDLFLDNDGVIRCKGRLQNAAMDDSAKHPALIPKNSTIAKLIIISVHEQVFHYGAESTLARLIQRFWIPSARPQVKRVCRECVRCRREHGPSFTLPDPAPLPADRIKEAYPFEVTGVDYTGAIPIRQKGEDISAYLLIFTCGVTRGIHLEVVEDMTSASFIDALRRFTSHHSIPRVIYSDNATTFISASNILTQLFNHSDVAAELVKMRTTWKFIPKRAPWYGGWWERLVALTKTALRKMVGRTRLNFIQLQTVSAQIEAVLNDRPLTRVSTDINTFEPLTPSHLMYGRRITTLPFHYTADEEADDPTYGRSTEPLVLSRAYLRTQNILRAFWRHWSEVYLPALREHHQKTRGPIEELIKIGDVVQVHAETKRAEWKLAVVEQLNRGADGLVRSAEIRTSNGKTSRPINKLFPLEVIESTLKIRPESNKTTGPAVSSPAALNSPVSSGQTGPSQTESQAQNHQSSTPSASSTGGSQPVPGRPQRKAAQQAKDRIQRMARLESIEEED